MHDSRTLQKSQRNFDIKQFEQVNDLTVAATLNMKFIIPTS